MSKAHNKDINDAKLIDYFKNKKLNIIDISPDYLIKNKKFFINFTIIALINLFKNKDIQFISLLKEEVNTIKSIFYLFQTSYVMSLCIENRYICIYRGNNISAIKYLKNRNNIHSIIIPHGLYIVDPPENNFFYFSDCIVTGTRYWPNEKYKGNILKIGMIENLNLTNVNIKKINTIGLITTHSRQHEANIVNRFISKQKNKFKINIRLHPRNEEFGKLLTNKNFVDNNKEPISDYLKTIDAIVLNIGYNNRVSNVIYEAAIMGLPVFILNDVEKTKIINLSDEVNKYYADNTDMEIHLSSGLKLSNIIKNDVIINDDIYEDLFQYIDLI